MSNAEASQAATGRPGVSIIIPTRNRLDALADALASIGAQTVLPTEVLIVDQTPGASAATVQGRLPSLPSAIAVRHFFNAQISGLTTARNFAMDRAQGDILLFLDDDVTLYPDFIQRLLASYVQNPAAVGISGIPDNYAPPGAFFSIWSKIFMLKPLYDDRLPVYWIAATLTQPVQVTRFTGAMMSFRREKLQGVRFDSNLTGVCDGEDVDFCLHLRGTLWIEPGCKLMHHFHPQGRERDHWTRRHARAYAYLYRRNWRSHPLAYAWLRVGYAVAAIAGCASRLSLGPWHAMTSGIREGTIAAQPSS